MQAPLPRKNIEMSLIDGPRRASYWDDLSRKVYCVLGIPIDLIDMPNLLHAVEDAAANKYCFFVSTPNLHYLVNSRFDRAFRETVLLSDLCPADGAPIVWIARLLGLPIRLRVAGSDMVDALMTSPRSGQRLDLFLFGGDKGVVEVAAKAVNDKNGGLRCVGAFYPGFGTVEDMSRDHIIDQINASHADFLLVALGAKKGQLWLQRNHTRLQIPVRAHLGAAINFAAAKVRRAPPLVRTLGLEWLWRIKEEPHLWRRYWHDGIIFLQMLFTCVLPLAVRIWWRRLRNRPPEGLTVKSIEDCGTLTLSLSGAAIGENVDAAIGVFREAAAADKVITINLANTSDIDARFLGLLLMLRKQLRRAGADLKFVGSPVRLRKMFRLYGASFLLALDQGE